MFLFVLDPGLIRYEFLSSASVLKLISLILKKKNIWMVESSFAKILLRYLS